LRIATLRRNHAECTGACLDDCSLKGVKLDSSAFVGVLLPIMQDRRRAKHDEATMTKAKDEGSAALLMGSRQDATQERNRIVRQASRVPLDLTKPIVKPTGAGPPSLKEVRPIRI
jgi:hypothetical protein